MAPINDKKKKKKRKTKKNKFDDDFVMETKNVAKKLHEKYKKQKIEDETVKNPIINNGILVHPTRYVQFIERANKAQWNRISLPADPPEKLIPTKWICAICQHYSCYKSLGDLCGPYYFELNLDSTFVPDFLFVDNTKLPKKSYEDPPNIEIFIHGRCAIWSENLFFLGGKFPMLESRLYQYWKKKCKFCKKIGASIRYVSQNNDFGHYQCLVDQGYELDSMTFSISPPSSRTKINNHINGNIDVKSYINSITSK